MYLLTVIHNGTVTKIPFEGEKPLEKLLMEAGLAHPHPCGGRGVCGKCAVEITGELSPLTEAERKAGSRLSCQTVLMGDATLTLKDTSEGMRIESESRAEAAASRPMAGKYGAAVDIGTTTVALRIYDLADGMVVGSAAALNPQRSVAADVMGRIDAACHGQDGRSPLTPLCSAVIPPCFIFLWDGIPRLSPPPPLRQTPCLIPKRKFLAFPPICLLVWVRL